MKENNLDALCANMDILIAGLGVLISFDLNGNHTDSRVWSTGETGDIHSSLLN